MREEYENKIKMLMVEIADLKYKLEKRVEKEQITSDSNDNYELDIIPSSYRVNITNSLLKYVFIHVAF